MTAEPSYEGQQIGVHMLLGFIPVLRVRQAVPNDGYGWEWGRWRFANAAEIMLINAKLIPTWKK